MGLKETNLPSTAYFEKGDTGVMAGYISEHKKTGTDNKRKSLDRGGERQAQMSNNEGPRSNNSFGQK